MNENNEFDRDSLDENIDDQLAADNLEDNVTYSKPVPKNSLFINSLHQNCPLKSNIVVIGESGKIIDVRNQFGQKNRAFHWMKFKNFQQSKQQIQTRKHCPLLNAASNQSSSKIIEKMYEMKNNIKSLKIRADNLSTENFSEDIDVSANEPIDDDDETQDNLLKLNQTIFNTTIGNRSKCLADNSMYASFDDQSQSTDSLEQLNETLYLETNDSLNDSNQKSILADETINRTVKYDENEISMIIDETKLMDSDSLDSSSSSSTPYDHHSSSATNNQIDQQIDCDEIKLKIFKRKKMAKDSSQTAADCRVQRDFQCEMMFQELCHNCQEYYSSRVLSVDKLQVLLDKCSKHRGHFTVTGKGYRSPKNFWNIDFK